MLLRQLFYGNMPLPLQIPRNKIYSSCAAGMTLPWFIPKAISSDWIAAVKVGEGSFY
jgi:hypothetical protein